MELFMFVKMSGKNFNMSVNISLPTLYSRASTGALRQWTIEYSGKAYRTHSGVVDGKITTSDWYVVEATNVGRSNERDLSDQARFEAHQKWKKKTETGYFENADAVDDSVGYVEPMLAKKLEDRKDSISFPLYSQPKYDGLRCLISANGIATTRNGKDWKTIPHIHEALAPMFEAYPDLILDGELYNHEFHDDFNKITSLAKKTKPTKSDLAESAEKLQFYWYDIVDTEMNFAKRTNLIVLLYNHFLRLDSGAEHKSIKRVETHCIQSFEEMDTYYGKYMDEGYEGQMIRLDEPYENKRSNSLLKRKEFTDEEYRIVDVCEGKGNRAGVAGYMVLAREDNVTFHSNIKADFETLGEFLKDRNKLIGKYATCQYFHLTPDGIPRFPFITKIRDGKGVD